MAFLPPWSKFKQTVFKSPAAVSIWLIVLFFAGALLYSRFVAQPQQEARRQAPSVPENRPTRRQESEPAQDQVTRPMARMNGWATPPPATTVHNDLPPALLGNPTPTPPALQAESLSVLDGSPQAAVTPPPLPGATPVASPAGPSGYERAVAALSAKEPIRRYSDRSAPYGRRIKCRLVNTLISSNAQTPLIGLTQEEVWWNGQLVVPIDTEVHGTTEPSVVRDRIAANDRFVLVFHGQDGYPNGVEMVVKGAVLERDDAAASQGTWGLYDGAFGLKGQVVQFATDKQIQLFLATALSTAAQGLQTTTSSGAYGGTQVEPTAHNALLAGTSGVLNQYADQMLEYVKKNSEFVLVPGGHPFYLYVMDDVDGEDARVGGTQEASFQRHREREQQETDATFRRELEPAQNPLTEAIRANAAARASVNVGDTGSTPQGSEAGVQPPGGYQPPGSPPLTPGAERDPHAVYGPSVPPTFEPNSKP